MTFNIRCFILCLCIIPIELFSQLPTLSSGKIERIENFQSKFVQARNVDVWIPDNYDGIKKFSVVYMHDGQMLFDANSTWNKQEWKVDEVFSQLIKDKKIENCLVVAVWNTGENRITEYFPQKIFDELSPELKKSLQEKYKVNKPGSDQYLKFLTEELKPYIDKQYKTKTDKDNTIMMGSSMGGLISLYAISEYPEIFGTAGCISTAWLGFVSPEIPKATETYLNKNLASSLGHKLYFDYGTKETDLDPDFQKSQNKIDSLCLSKGYQKNINFKSEVIPDGEHNETAWAARLNKPIEFLLPKRQNQQPSSGKLDLYEDFKSNYVTERNIEVWLPDGYTKNKKYAVLYMNDGQMLYDAKTTWNKQAWDADDVAQKLMNQKKVRDFIIVGIWNGGKTRHKDYFPQKPFDDMTQAEKDTVTAQLIRKGRTTGIFQPVSDNYLKFIVTELKPFIDKTYSVYPDKNNTFIMGSSMGGLISMYAVTQYPDVFGGAACLSTHWPGIFEMKNNPVPQAFYTYLKQNIGKLKNNKLYFDYGDQTLDALYPPLQKQVDTIIESYISQKGKEKLIWKTEFFPGEDHSERAWNKRLAIPMEFLLGK